MSSLNVDEALTAALKNFNDLNIFLYYPSVLSDVVFSDPKIYFSTKLQNWFTSAIVSDCSFETRG